MGEEKGTRNFEDHWPGLDPKPGEINLDETSEKVDTALGKFEDALSRLEGILPGSLRDLRESAIIVGPHVPEWNAGVEFFRVVKKTGEAVTHVYEMSVYMAKAAYEKAEAARVGMKGADQANAQGGR